MYYMYSRKQKFIAYVLFSLILSLCSHVFAVEIVRLNIEFDNTSGVLTPHTLDIELFDDVTPLTVSNYLNYINSGKYDGSFVSRSVLNFIIQAGGYTFRPDDPATNFLHPTDTLQELVPLENSSPVKNEYLLTSLTNVRGTVAMAKLSHDPNSASNEWFINLADNRANLDNQNDGFTVFGRIIDDGMDLADEVSNLPIQPFAGSILGAAFSALPVANYNLVVEPKIFQKNLIMITSATSNITRPILRFTPNINTFPLDVAGDGTGSLQVVTLTNTGNESLTVSPIINTLPAEFNIETDNCSNTTLDPTVSSCDISIRFIATVESVINESLNIDYTSATANYSVSLELIAEGVSATAVLDVSETDIVFSATDQGATDTHDLILHNKGGTDLTINSISTDNTDFTVDNIDCIISMTLSLDQKCTLVISFTPTSVTSLASILDITTTAGNASIQLSGSGVDPEISVPATVDFGSTIIIGQSVTKQIVISNTGSNGLLLGAFTLTGIDADEFSLVTNCPSGFMNTGAACAIDLTYNPVAGKSISASLEIESNDVTDPAIITLTGDVVDLRISEGTIEFGSKLIDGSADSFVLTLDNAGAGIITISDISITGDVSNVFSFDIDGCVNGSTLGSCDLMVNFLPVQIGSYTASLIVKTDVGDLVLPLSGDGGKPVVNAQQDIYVGISQINGLSTSQSFLVGNTGSQDLIISNPVSVSGANSEEFTVVPINCPANESNDILLRPAGPTTPLVLSQCVFTAILNGETTGSKTATLTLSSNDPVNPDYIISLTGETANDIDGVADSIEAQAGNGGDANNDDLADEFQNNVASFITGTGKAVTIASEDATLFLSTGLTSEMDTVLLNVTDLKQVPVEFPDDKIFDLGIYSFTVKVNEANGLIDPDTQNIVINVGIFLPAGVKVDKYYRLGPTPDNPEPHLYDFTYDSNTGLGAQIYGPVTVTSDSGDSISANLVIISYLDGGLGDDDLTINGFIENGTGGFSSVVDNGGSSGSISLHYSLLLFTLLLLIRIKNYDQLFHD